MAYDLIAGEADRGAPLPFPGLSVGGERLAVIRTDGPVTLRQPRVGQWVPESGRAPTADGGRRPKATGRRPRPRTPSTQSPGRGSVFDGIADPVHAPRDARVQIASGAGGRFALAGAKCER